MAAEDECRNLLRRSGSKFYRRTAEGREMWHLPNGLVFTCSPPGRGRLGSWDNALPRLRRLLGPELVARAERAEAIVASSKQQLAAAAGSPAWSSHNIEEPMPTFNAPKLVVTTPPEKKKADHFGPKWTPEQDKVLVEARDAKFSWDDVFKLVEPTRPGLTMSGMTQRYYDLRRKAAKTTKAEAPAPVAAVAQTPPAPLAPAPVVAEPVAKTEPGLARIVFEIDGKTRVVHVDRETARQMLAKAMEF